MSATTVPIAEAEGALVALRKLIAAAPALDTVTLHIYRGKYAYGQQRSCVVELTKGKLIVLADIEESLELTLLELQKKKLEELKMEGARIEMEKNELQAAIMLKVMAN